MISAAIFLLHGILAVVLGVRGWRKTRADATLGVALVVLVFAVGWTLSTFVTNLAWPERGVGILIDDWRDSELKRFLYREIQSDTASLLLLTMGELPFYIFYLRKGKEHSGATDAMS